MTDRKTTEREADELDVKGVQDDLELKDEDAERIAGGDGTAPRDPATGLPTGKRF